VEPPGRQADGRGETFDEKGLAQAALTHAEWGAVTVKRTAIKPIEEIADGALSAKKGFFIRHIGLKGMMGWATRRRFPPPARRARGWRRGNMDKPSPNYAAVDEVQKLGVTSAEVDAFAKRGG